MASVLSSVVLEVPSVVWLISVVAFEEAELASSTLTALSAAAFTPLTIPQNNRNHIIINRNFIFTFILLVRELDLGVSKLRFYVSYTS